MSEQDPKSSPSFVPQPPENKWRTLALILLPLIGILLIVLAVYLVRPRQPGIVTTVQPQGASTGTGEINLGQIIDATQAGVQVDARLGYRYKLFVEDESDDRSSGIARLGGRATFIPNARRGQTVVADVTRVRERVIDAVLVQVLSQVNLPPKPPRQPYVPPAGDSTAAVVEGAEMDVIIAETSSKNPLVDGIARVAGLVVIVNGAPTVGERVNVRITDRRERMAFAEVTGNPPGTDPLPVYESRPARAVFTPPPGDPVVVGAEMDVVIAEESDKNPGVEGIAKIGGLVVAVEGATTVGERVNIRITGRRERIAFAELSGKPAGTGPLPEYKDLRPARPARAVFTPPPGDPVVVGAEMDVVIAEESDKNPGVEGIAKIGGLVVAVEGATTVGERVNIRITGRRERIAFAELSGKPAGTGPLPEYKDLRPARPARAVFTPPPGDPVVAGAEMDVIITEASAQRPGEEGITRINGLVVAVRGVTQIGERVHVRIVERRRGIAFAEPTGKPVGSAPLVDGPTGGMLRRAFSPRANDPAAHVIAGAEMDVTILESSKQSPETEGVTKVNGLVVFVQGASTVGERVRIRVNSRRERVAFADAIGPALTAAEPVATPAVEAPAPAVAEPVAAPAVEPAVAPAVAEPVAAPVAP